jgi:hypothetical protein
VAGELRVLDRRLLTARGGAGRDAVGGMAFAVALESPRRQPTVWSLQAGTVRGGRQGELCGLDDLDDNQFLAAVAPTGRWMR